MRASPRANPLFSLSFFPALIDLVLVHLRDIEIHTNWLVLPSIAKIPDSVLRHVGHNRRNGLDFRNAEGRRKRR